MKNLSSVQACLIWSDLEQAYYGDAAYGGDVAEIYAYKFMQFHPLYHANVVKPESGLYKEAEQSAVRQAADSLYEILVLFTEKREVIVEIHVGYYGDPKGWQKVDEWLRDYWFNHRIHVRIRHKKGGDVEESKC